MYGDDNMRSKIITLFSVAERDMTTKFPDQYSCQATASMREKLIFDWNVLNGTHGIQRKGVTIRYIFSLPIYFQKLLTNLLIVNFLQTYNFGLMHKQLCLIEYF